MTPDEQTAKLAEYLSFLAGIKDAANAYWRLKSRCVP